MPDVADPKPYLEHGILGVSLLITILNFTFFAWMTNKHFHAFTSAIQVLENVKGHVKALQDIARDARDNNRQRRS